MKIIIIYLFCLISFGCASIRCFSIDGKQASWCEAKLRAENKCGKNNVKSYSPVSEAVCK